MLTGVATRVGSRMGALRGMGQRLMSSGAGTAARQAPRAQGIVAKAFKPTKSPGFITSSFAGESASRIGDSVTKTAYNKQADILKRIQANIQMSPSDVERYRRVADQARSAKRMSKNAMLALAPYGIEQIANVCVATGVNLAPEEIQFLVLAGEGEQKTAEILYDNNWVIEPQCVDTSEQMWLDPTSVNSALYNQVASAQAFMDMRSDNLPHAASAQRFQMAKEAFYGMNPRVYRRPAPAPGRYRRRMT